MNLDEIKDFYITKNSAHRDIEWYLLEHEIQPALGLQITKGANDTWVINQDNKKVTFKIGYDGIISVYLQEKLTSEEKTSLDTSVDFLGTKGLSPDYFYLSDEEGLGRFITKVKMFLF